MLRSRWTLLSMPFFAALGLAVAHGCSDLVVTPLAPGAQGITTPGVVGDPCIPSNEKGLVFQGFELQNLYVETGAFASCESGVCLINHFQGRASCPLGQAPPKRCLGTTDVTTCGDEKCLESAVLDLDCDPKAADQGAAACSGVGTCDPARSKCVCATDADCHDGMRCEADHLCKLHVCGTAGACQVWNATDADNAGKACCAPDTGKPVGDAVCGQCGASSHREAAEAVHCSCRCGPPDGAPPDFEADYCDCPDGFTCSGMLAYNGIQDLDVAGKYCVKAGSEYDFASAAACGEVKGYVADSKMCLGSAASSP
jgi:hypothetical protein